MSYRFDIPYPTSCGESYIFINYHHQAMNALKSIWIINCDDELDLFISSINNNYVVLESSSTSSYNFLKNNNKFVVIGQSRDGRNLFLSKFIKNSSNHDWHGYPADYMSKSQDIPSDAILDSMVNNQLINNRERKRIKKAQKIQ